MKQHSNKSGLFSKTDKQDMAMKNTTKITIDQMIHWKEFITVHQTSPKKQLRWAQFCRQKHQQTKLKKMAHWWNKNITSLIQRHSKMTEHWNECRVKTILKNPERLLDTEN